MNAWTTYVLPVSLAVIGSTIAVEVMRLIWARRPLRVQEEFTDRARQKEAVAAARERAEEAHVSAAAAHTETVTKVYAIVNDIASEIVGPEVDFFDPAASSVSDPRAEAGAAIRALRGVWSAHPTKAVRIAARKLSDELSVFYGDRFIMQQPQEDWSHDKLLSHLKLAEELIEALHSLPPAKADL